MENYGSKYKQHSLYYAAALLAPLTHAASVSSWAVTLVIAAGSIILSKATRWGTGWVLTVQTIWASVIAGMFLQWSECYWQSLPIGGAAPLILLALVVWTVNVKGKATKIGCVLLWPLVLLIASVLLSGISEIQTDYLKPEWKTWNLSLLAVFMIPSAEGKKIGWKLPLSALAVSIITTGVLSSKVTTESCSGIYELSRSLSLLGVAERFESLIAAAMTLGFYCATAYLLEKKEEDQPIWGTAAVAALVYLTKVPLPSWFLAAGSLLMWVILPVVGKGKIIAKN